MTRKVSSRRLGSTYHGSGAASSSLALKAREEGQGRGTKCGERVRVVGEEVRRGPRLCPEGSGEAAASWV